MRTLVLDAEQGEAAIRAAAEILLFRGLVAFPTETVYGLGALGLDSEALEKVFVAKRRPHSDPLILHVAFPDALSPLVRQISPTARLLMERFWPGPLTLVLPKSELVPELATGGLDSVAVRMPAHPVALALLGAVDRPLAAPSANLFSRTSPTTADHVLQDLEGRIDAVLDGGPTTVGVESTVIDLRGEVPAILRPGGVTRESLEAALGYPVTVRGEAGGEMRSPGLLTKHYSPRADICLYEGPDQVVLRAILKAATAGDAVLAFEEDLPALTAFTGPVVSLGSRKAPEQAAQRLYRAFRELDAAGITRIYARLAPACGMGDAVNDRLRRAASGKVISLR